jgi:hypothetical protein
MDFEEIAVRAWTNQRGNVGHSDQVPPPARLLVLDTETTTDVSQRLTFGSAKLVGIKWSQHRDGSYSYRNHEILGEVIFEADDLAVTDARGHTILVDYCEKNAVNLISHSEFMESWFRYYCETRPNSRGERIADAVVTGFNLPFDLSRMAFRYTSGTGKNKGSFTLYMHPDVEPCAEDCSKKHKHVKEAQTNRYRPRIRIQALDSKKSLISFTSSMDTSFKDGRGTGDFGRFLDIRQLVWGMTNASHSLASACAAFGLPPELCKGSTDSFVITPEFVDYNRQDVTATAELAVAALTEYGRNPIDLPPNKVFSPASISKAYVRKMGITPLLDRPGVAKDAVMLGNCTSTFYGGRAECHIRHVPVPVALLDVTSMYPTVNTLMRLWDHLTAESISVHDATTEFREYVKGFTLKKALDPSEWPAFTGFVQVKPDNEILPVRAKYNTESRTVGLNYLSSTKPLWYTIPDVLVSILLTGKTPEILSAIRFVPSESKISGLETIALAGVMNVNPVEHDFFKTVIEYRQVLKKAGKKREAELLKVIANSGSYGIFVEMLRKETSEPELHTVYGADGDPWESVAPLETAQEFCYPPIGAVITGAARLVLAIMERLVTDAGGTWLFCDTDSMAVVSNREGSLIPCDGGQHRTEDGREAIRALTPSEVENIRHTVNALNPYDRSKVPDILKHETADTNATGQVYGYGISAKRYTLFVYQDGRPYVPDEIDGKRAYSEHGLGLYLPPSGKRDWIRETWQYLLDDSHGYEPAMPAWEDMPALIRTTISSPYVLNMIKKFNRGKNYQELVKPFGFVLLATIRKYNPVTIIGPSSRLISPYSSNRRTG